MTLNYLSFIPQNKMITPTPDTDLELYEEINSALLRVNSRTNLMEMPAFRVPGRSIYFWMIDEEEPGEVDNSFNTPLEAIVSLIVYLESYLPNEFEDDDDDDEI